jgi:hypothetical protein
MQFAQATENAFTLEELIFQEQLILNNIQWDMDLPNLSTWINNTTINWDSFIENIDTFSEDIAFNVDFLRPFKFRDRNLQSFNLFRSLTQFVDIICLDVEYLSFTEKYLTTSVIFLLILKCFGMVNFLQIPFLQMENIEYVNEVVILFNRYLNHFYNIEFVNIFDHIQYVSCYMDSVLNFNDVEQMDEVCFIFFYLYLFIFYYRIILMKIFYKFKLIIRKISIMILELIIGKCY